MKQKQKLKRPWHRLLVLFGCLFALSQAGFAYKNYTINGDPNMTFSEGKNGSGNDEYSLTNVVLPANFKFKIRVQFDDSDDYHEYGPANGKSIILTENSREDNASGLNKEGDYITIVNAGRYSFYLAPEGSNGSAPATLYIARNVAPTDVYLRGEINSTAWATEENWHFRYDEVSDTYILDNVFIPAGKLFKVADADWGANNINYGVSSNKEVDLSNTSSQELEFDKSNSIKLKNDFEGRVTFHIDSYRGTATITFETPKASWYLANDWTGNWETGTPFESKGNNTYELVCNSYNTNNVFKINDGTTWYIPCNEKGNAITTLQNGIVYSNLQDKEGDMVLPASANGKRVVFTLTVGNDGKPASFKAEWDGYTNYALYNEDLDSYVDLAWNDDDKAFIGAIYPPKQNDQKWEKFKVKIGKAGYSTSKLFGYKNYVYNVNTGTEYSMDLSESTNKDNEYFNTKNSTVPYKVLVYVNDEGIPTSMKLEKMDLYITYQQGGSGDFTDSQMISSSDGYTFNYIYDYAGNNGGVADVLFHFIAKKGDLTIDFGATNDKEYYSFTEFKNKSLNGYSSNNFLINGWESQLKGLVTFTVSSNFQNVSVSLADFSTLQFTDYFVKKYNVDQYIDFTWNARGGYYQAVMPSVWKDNQFHVNVAINGNRTNALSYGWGSSNWWVQPGYLTIDMEMGKYALEFKEGDDYEMRLYVAENKEGNLPIRLEFVKIAENGMPFYPKDMSKGDFEELLKDAPTTEYFYLVGHALNNGRPSPEWQLDETGNGKYYIDFTWFDHETEDCGGNPDDKANSMRKKVKLVKYVANQTSSEPSTVVDYVEVPLELQTKNDRYYGKAGVRARVTYDPSNASKPLTFEYLKFDGTTTSDSKEAQYLPMVSLVGKLWLQGEGVPVNIDVPKGDKKFDNNWDNTSQGWQQAWIQYDKDGNPVTSRDGHKVYFNTQWPPVNPISFTTSYTDEAGEHVIELSSENLTFTQVSEAKSASYWKENGFEMVDFDCDEPEKDGGDGSLYALYTVSDMWITGDFKLWTGWSGSRKSDGGDGADWMWNWGHYMETEWPGTWNLQENDQYNQGHTPELATGTGTVHLGTANGDMSFSKPAHFSNVYFFLDLNHPNNQDKKHCLLYFERGAISIMAEGKDYTYGMFTPELTDIDEGSKVTHITLSVLKNNEDKEFVDTIWDIEIPEGTVIDSPKDFLNYFKANFTEKSTGNLFWDKKDDYASGSYVYKLDVTVLNQLGGISPLSTTSNPFRIYKNAIEHTLSASQLIELPTDESLPYHSDIAGYTHITYSTSFSNRLIAFDADGKVSRMINRPANLSEEEVTDIYQETGKWTNKVFVRTSVPADYTADDMGVASVGEPEFTIEVAGDEVFNGKKLEKIPNSSYYGIVVTRAEGDFTPKTIQSRMDAQVQIETDGQMESIQDITAISAPNARVSYTPLIPTPRVLDARVELYYGADNSDTDESNNDAQDFWFTSEASGKDYKITSARYQNVREIVQIDLPNVEDAIKTTVNGMFNYYFVLDNDASNTETIEIGEDGFLPSETVKPSTLFVKEDGGICDEKVLYFNTTAANTYDRVWNKYDDGRITSIDISTDAPLNDTDKLKQENAVVEVRNAIIRYEEGSGLNLKGVFDVFIKMIAKDGNDMDHVDKDVDNDDLLHGDTKDGRYDYFFLAVAPSGQVEPLFEDVATVEQLHINKSVSSNEDEPGYTMTVKYDFGEVPNNWSDVKPYLEKLTEYIKTLELRVSYLYPFWVEDEPHGDSPVAEGKARVAAKLSGDVLKSEATVWPLDAYITYDNVATGIDGLTYGADIEVGRGYIDLNGNDGNIFSADGMKVYAGNGRAYVAPGVYVVTFYGQTKKVLVK